MVGTITIVITAPGDEALAVTLKTKAQTIQGLPAGSKVEVTYATAV